MNKSLRKRLCWNCEASVSLAEELCPFCGVSVVPAFLEGTGADFAPPYSNNGDKNFDIPKSPYDRDESATQLEKEEIQKEIDQAGVSLDDFKRIVLSVILLLTGSVLFLFSVVLALFSMNGIFTLQWDGSVWFIYLILAIPLFAFGWRVLMKLDPN